MPTKIYDNFNIQTWKKLLVSFKMYAWFTEKNLLLTNQKQNTKN